MFDTLWKEGPHYRQEKCEFWAEDGLIFLEDERDGTFAIITCADIKARAVALYKEAKRAANAGYMDSRDNLNEWVIKLGEVWKDAKDQGDPCDIEVAKERYKQRRKAVLVTGIW